jgi:hypothetical protein
VGVEVGVGIGRGVGVDLGGGVGRGVARRIVGVGVGRLDSGIIVRASPKTILSTTIRLNIPKMICCPLPRQRLTFSSDNEDW